MKKVGFALVAVLLLASGCKKQPEELFTIAVFQIIDAPTLNETRKGFLQALAENGLRDGVNVRLTIRNAMGDVVEAQRIAREFAARPTDLIVALSTQCLQAALMAAPRNRIVFTSVANPQLLGVGRTAENHLQNVTGVASTGPIRQILAFIKEVLPRARRIGTLWTPSELNSEFYLQVAREAAVDLGLEIVAVPVANVNEVLFSAQMLLSKNIDVLFPISDNTINASFESIGRLAGENGIPLFGGSPLFTRLGACAAMGWDFFEMGYKTGEMAVRIMNGESPGRIPIQYMSNVKLHLNLAAAQKQGIRFAPEIIQRADHVIGVEGIPGQAEAEK
ncbi:MAG: ABC transporter substrate-binding protein [Candidatus Aminicenantes bacterium]|nr:ABC transporter substrate-binding protein [Candidatus Aminicenantes bacterium]